MLAGAVLVDAALPGALGALSLGRCGASGDGGEVPPPGKEPGAQQQHTATTGTERQAFPLGRLRAAPWQWLVEEVLQELVDQE